MRYGYHLKEIPKGVLGEASKIEEEVKEFLDAMDQDNKVMALLELSDLIGAIELFLERYHPEIKLADLIKMSEATRLAFKNGHRK